MQTYGSLQHQIQQFNDLIFGCGFYYYWAFEHKRAMRTNRTENINGKTLVLYSMFDPIYEQNTIELYFKKCTAHNLPKEYYIPDHWHIPPLAIEEVEFIDKKENNKEQFVKRFTIRLYTSSPFEGKEYFSIKAVAFYFERK